MQNLLDLAQEAVYEMRHLSTDSEFGLSTDLQEAIAQYTDNSPPMKSTTDFSLWHGTNNANPHDTISQVREFEQACGATLYPLGQVPPLDKLKLRLSLELEELYEKAQAMGLEGTFQRRLFDKIQEANCVGLGCDTSYSAVSPDYSIDFVPDDDTLAYDPVALLDACCDQRYVQDGTMLTCGLDATFPEAFANVHASNMSKFPKTGEELQASVEKYTLAKVDFSFTLSENNTKFPGVLRRKADGKILKSATYTPADLAPIIAKYTA